MIRRYITSMRRGIAVRVDPQMRDAQRVIGDLHRAHTKLLAENATLTTELAAARSVLRTAR
jgi:cellobiose-specific phosphotransferase system component IIA